MNLDTLFKKWFNTTGNHEAAAIMVLVEIVKEWMDKPNRKTK